MRKIMQPFADQYHDAFMALFESFGTPWDGKVDVADAVEDACEAARTA